MIALRESRSRLALVLVGITVLEAVAARLVGYDVGGMTPVRCRDGHLFTTLWIPGISLKAVRLGWFRLQWCPVGHHWTVVFPVRRVDLTAAESREAAAHQDAPLP